MAQGDWDIGDAPVLTATFKDTADALADPTTVRFSYKSPDNNVTTAEWTQAVPGSVITRVSLGVFTASVPLTQAGFYAWQWKGIGAVPAVSESDADTALHVRNSAFPS
jgi:hypothetical protein